MKYPEKRNNPPCYTYAEAIEKILLYICREIEKLTGSEK